MVDDKDIWVTYENRIYTLINNKKISHLLKEINKQVKEPRFEF